MGTWFALLFWVLMIVWVWRTRPYLFLFGEDDPLAEDDDADEGVEDPVVELPTVDRRVDEEAPNPFEPPRSGR